MADVCVPSWGYDKFDGMNDNWIIRACAQALDYRGCDSGLTQNEIIRELRDTRAFDTFGNWVEFTVGGETYILATEDNYDGRVEVAITEMVEEAEYELDYNLKDAGWLTPYISVDREMLARDLQHDKDHLIGTYDGRVDEITVGMYLGDGKVYRHGSWYIWRTN